MADIALLGIEVGQWYWSRTLEGQVQTGSIPSQCALSPPPPRHWCLCPILSRRCQRGHPLRDRACDGMVPACQSSRLFPICYLNKSQQWPSSLLPDTVPCLIQFHPPQLHSPLVNGSIHPSMELHQRQRCWSSFACWGGGCIGCSKQARVLGCFILLPLPCFGCRQVCACSSQVESRFLTAPC